MRQGLARALGGVAVVVLIAGAAACNKGSSSGGGDNAGGGKNCGLELAYLGALTGPSANLGVNIEQGAELAVEQYNKKNGENCIKINKFDTQGSPDVAPGLARQLVTNKKIVGVVGLPFSGESQAAMPILNEAKIPNISPSATNPTLSTKGWTFFHRAVANDDAQGPAAGAYIKDVLKAQKVFVVDDQSAYGAGLAEQVTKTLGSAVAGTDKVGGEGKQTDFSATVTKDGNSLGGNTPARATISQRPSTTTNGKALRAIARQRAFSFAAGFAAMVPGAAVTSAMI